MGAIDATPEPRFPIQCPRLLELQPRQHVELEQVARHEAKWLPAARVRCGARGRTGFVDFQAVMTSATAYDNGTELWSSTPPREDAAFRAR
jgi:hypothetical protein